MMHNNEPRDIYTETPLLHPDAATTEAVRLIMSTTFDSGHERARVVKALPASAEPQAAEVPWLHFAGGFGNNNLPPLHYLASCGINAFSIVTEPKFRDKRFVAIRHDREESTPSIIGIREAMRLRDDPSVRLVTSLDRIGMAVTLLAGMDLAGIRSANGIFQSADAANGLLAAYLAPHKFPYIVQAYPGSYIRKPELLPAMRGALAARRLRKNTPIENSYRDAVSSDQMQKIYGKRAKPANGGFAAAASATLSHHSHLLSELRTLPTSTAVSWTVGEQDGLFTAESLLSSLQHPDDIRFFQVLPGPHGYRHRKDVTNKTLGLFALMRDQDARGLALPPLRDRLILPSHMSPSRVRTLCDLADRVGAA